MYEALIECVHSHAIQKKIKNHLVDKVKKFDISGDKLRRQFSKFKKD